MYDPKLYIVSLTITTGIVPQVFEVLEVRAGGGGGGGGGASPPPPSFGTYFKTFTESILVLMLVYFAPCSTSRSSISAFVVAPQKR